MESSAELVRLEEFVDKLLMKYNKLKVDYHSLQETLQEREVECGKLKNNISNLSIERTEVGNRVAGLIGRIEQWENEHDVVTVEESGNNIQGSLFGEDAENKSN